MSKCNALYICTYICRCIHTYRFSRKEKSVCFPLELERWRNQNIGSCYKMRVWVWEDGTADKVLS